MSESLWATDQLTLDYGVERSDSALQARASSERVRSQQDFHHRSPSGEGAPCCSAVLTAIFGFSEYSMTTRR